MKIFTLTLAALLALGARGQEHRHGAGAEASQPQATSSECQSMLADMKAMDTRLDEKMAAMNGAGGEAKVQAMAALIDQLGSQRRCMRESMMQANGGHNARMSTQMPSRSASMPMSKCGSHAGRH